MSRWYTKLTYKDGKVSKIIGISGTDESMNPIDAESLYRSCYGDDIIDDRGGPCDEISVIEIYRDGTLICELSGCVGKIRNGGKDLTKLLGEGIRRVEKVGARQLVGQEGAEINERLDRFQDYIDEHFTFTAERKSQELPPIGPDERPTEEELERFFNGEGVEID